MTTPLLHTDGFYDSGPVEWVEWHAGVHMRETHYHWWRFYPNGLWVHCYRSEPDFEFWDFTEALTLQDIHCAQRDGTRQIEDGLPLFSAGTYAVAGEDLATRFEWRIPLSTGGSQVFNSESQWTICHDALRRRDGEDSTEFRFIRAG